MKQNPSATFLPVPGEPGEYLSSMSHRQPVLELNTKHLTSMEHRMPLIREASPVLQKLEKISSHQRMLDWLKANFPSQCRALAKEEKQAENNRLQELCQGNKIGGKKMTQAEDKQPQILSQRECCMDEGLSQAEKDNEKRLWQGEGSNDKELSQGENNAIWDIYNIWDNSQGPVNERDSYTAPHEVPSSLSSLGTEAAAEAVSDLPSTSPATARASRCCHGQSS